MRSWEKNAGLTDEEILRITKGPDDPGWSVFYAALVRAVDELYYDATRGELESLQEQGELPSEMIGVNLNRKTYHDLGREFDKAVTAGHIKFLNNQRTINQMLSFNNDFKAVETAEGHGESFVSTLLCFKAETDATPEIFIS